MANTQKQIKNELSKLGISKAIVGNAQVEGNPAVLVRWNGQEEYVTSIHLALGSEDVRDESDDQYVAWLKSTYADSNLK
jgi:hypothetical protein